jgi:hypothetical protein
MKLSTKISGRLVLALVVAIFPPVAMLAGADTAVARPPLPLAPACGDWSFNGKTFLVRSDGWVMNFTSYDNNVSGNAFFTHRVPGEPPFEGPGHVQGHIRDLHIIISEYVTAPAGRTYYWDGDINESGNASGSVLDLGTLPTGITWQLGENSAPLRCQSFAAPPPSQDLPDPTVSWDVWPGGLTAHITDHSGIASRCTYTADWYDRNFSLPANSTYDLVMWPSFPENRNWNITIACDNGTRTQTTYFF